jgi:hypothetical protein
LSAAPTEATAAPTEATRIRWTAWTKSALALAFMLVALVDAFPAHRESHKRLVQHLRPALNASGLYQGDWQLFAPDPDRINSWVQGRVTRSDGSSWYWSTPDWQRRSQLEKFLEGRHQKLSDALRLDSRRALWPYFADYILRQTPPAAGARPVRVELTRYWWDLPEPGQYAAEKARYGRLPPQRERFPNQFLYYSKTVD